MKEGSPESEAAASRPLLELAVVAGDAISFTPLPPTGAITIGRGEDCDVHVDNRSVSRRHAILHLGPPLQIEDLGSANGTFVADRRAPPGTGRTHPLSRLSRKTVEIELGERVNLGTTTFVVRRAPGAPADAPARSERPVGAPEGAIVRDPAMRALYAQAARAARGRINVLVLGETGVGKEVLARSIHARSPRAAGPYVELNCAALPESLLEGELFGHEKSAFTGATQARAGLLESADKGTVFIDEIGELPLSFQVKLLRVLEDRKVLRVGGRAPRKIDVRFVAATNRDLEAEVARGAFRQDLYFRLNGISLMIPPLRERVSEIAPLAEKFLVDARRQLDERGVPRISPEALRCLTAYAWPGNVRELRNVLERAAVLCAGDVVLLEDLPAHLIAAADKPPSGSAAAEHPAPAEELTEIHAPAIDGAAPGALKLEMKAIERQRIVLALAEASGNQTRAAKLLGISLRTLVTRLDEHGIARPRKKA